MQKLDTNTNTDSATSLSLLERLKDDGQKHQAWRDFVDRYGPRINHWCQRWGLQDADAADVTQNVMLQLSRQMESFEYNPQGKFRSWLKTITWRAWADYLKAQGRNPALPGSVDQLKRLDTLAAKDDLMARLDEEADTEILEIALNRVRKRVQKNTFEAFRLMAFQRLSGAEAAESLGMNVGAVYVAKARIDQMLSAEVDRLESPSGDDS